MVAPAMSHLICSTALVVLIVLTPVFYGYYMDKIHTALIERELTEIADYTSNTLANLYFMANFTNAVPLNLTKAIIYLPSNVEGSTYMLNIASADENTLKVTAYLKDRPSVIGESWLPPGLKADSKNSIQSSSKLALAGCYRNVTGFYVWLGIGA